MRKKFKAINLEEFKFIQRVYLTRDPEKAFTEVFGYFDQIELVHLLCRDPGRFIHILNAGIKGMKGLTAIEKLKLGGRPALMENCLQMTLVTQSDYEKNGNKKLKKRIVDGLEMLNDMYRQYVIFPSVPHSPLKIDQ